MVAAATTIRKQRDRPAVRLVEKSLPHNPKRLIDFAEQDIVIPTGDYKGTKWRREVAPWAAMLFDEIDSDYWNKIVTTGPSQSGKTQSCFAIPALRTIAEYRENAVFGIPDESMVNKKWRTDFVPIMRASPRLRHLLPTSGPGSQGGKITDAVTFGNGVEVALMTRGSGDATKAGFTARWLHVTEAADWSHGTASSLEANPLRQLEARQKSFKRARRRLLVEGTGKVEDCLPWSMRGREEGPLISSCSRLAVPCPHCGVFVTPERENFVGWSGAESEDQACEQATFLCPSCTAAISDDERKTANQDIRIIHHGQTIDERGEIHGDRPPVSTLWFRYSPFNNLLLEAGDIAAEEWAAEQLEEGTKDREDAEKALCMFTWARPYKSQLTGKHVKLEAAKIRKRVSRWPRNVCPPDTVLVTIGVDVGDWTCWYVVIAWRANGDRYIVGFGNFDVKRSLSDDVDTRIPLALGEFADGICEPGFSVEGRAEKLKPAAVWIDGGYKPDEVAIFIRSRGTFRDNRYKLCRGRGQSEKVRGRETKFTAPKRVSVRTPKVGGEWFAEVNHTRKIYEYTFNADAWKLSVHEGLKADEGAHHRIVFFEPSDDSELKKISNHLANEQLIPEWVDEKGLVWKWKRTGEQHWLDSTAMASACGDATGLLPAPMLDSKSEGSDDDASDESDEPEAGGWWNQWE